MDNLLGGVHHMKYSADFILFAEVGVEEFLAWYSEELQLSAVICNQFFALTTISPPCPDIHFPSREAVEPLRLLTGANFRSSSPVFFVGYEVEDPPVNPQAFTVETDLNDSGASNMEKKAKVLSKFLGKLRKVAAIFRSFKFPNFMIRSD
ncbi:hypothetical protein CPB84DRAFT_1827948 [Gymnopilus junonius]|uniref:Uncharacterized protein n=1 Tax=Gymnopilus junonius TaxID=109634 RepID=A0A9P5NG98_GYMJU|nr:hypothetical protein CPB84DRAFT_1827948 [Gymnopilus junonius]